MISHQHVPTVAQHHRAFLLMFFLISILFLTNIGAYKQFSRAESAFSLGARMMLDTNEFLLPHPPQGLPLNKPPLQYWLIGTSYRFLDIGYGASRVPSALCALGVIMLVYYLGLRLYGKLTALTAAAMLASSYLFLSFARLAMPDILLTLCISVALSCWTLVLTDQTARPRTLALIGYAAVACGFLAKGPVAVALAVTPISIELLIAHDFVHLKRLRPFSGLIVFLLIAAPYFFLVYARYGVEPIRTFFINENLQRFAGTGIYQSRMPALLYFTAFFGGFAPWSPLTAFVACLDFKHRSDTHMQRRALRMLYIWVIFPIIFFSASRFRLDYYLLPAMPAAALITARIASRYERSSSWSKPVMSIFALTLAVLLLIMASFTIRPVGLLFPGLSLRHLPFCVAAISFMPVLFFVWRGRVNYILLALIFAFFAIMLSILLIFPPNFSRSQPASLLASSVPAEANVYTSSEASEWAAELALHLPASQPVKTLIEGSDNSKLRAILQNDPRAVALVYEQEYSMLNRTGMQLNVLAQGYTYKGFRLTPKLFFHPVRERLLLVTK